MIEIFALTSLFAFSKTKQFLVKTEYLLDSIEEAGQDYQNYPNYQEYDDYNGKGKKLKTDICKNIKPLLPGLTP